MKNVLIFDLETTGLDRDKDEVIELGYVLWSVEHRTIIECYSALLPAESNAAEPFNLIPSSLLRQLGAYGSQDNAIPPAALSLGADPEIAWEIIANAARQSDCVVAHSAPFDRAFAEAAAAPENLLKLPWVCTLEDMVWPIQSAYRNLVSIALAHGVAVTSAHRAINDCLLLARLFERIDDIDDRLHLAMQRAARPKARFIARTSYEDKDKAKAAGFHWNGRVWHRTMAVEDAARLPFEVVNAAELSP
jgi:DNA polymerase-3 subunit epsilon